MMRHRKKHLDSGSLSPSDDEDNNNNHDEPGVSKLVTHHRPILPRMPTAIPVIPVTVMTESPKVVVSKHVLSVLRNEYVMNLNLRCILICSFCISRRIAPNSSRLLPPQRHSEPKPPPSPWSPIARTTVPTSSTTCWGSMWDPLTRCWILMTTPPNYWAFEDRCGNRECVECAAVVQCIQLGFLIVGLMINLHENC